MKRYQLRVISALCTNLAVVWIVIAIAPQNTQALIQGTTYAIVNVYFALQAEKRLEEYEY